MGGGLEGSAEVVANSRRQQRGSCIDHRNGRSRTRFLSQALLVCLVYVSIFGEAAHGYVDAYEQLTNYGFPIGLLPSTVTGYELAENGKFAVYLSGKCEIEIPSAFTVVYATKITGKLSYGSLKDLTGIQVKIYFVWLSITAISVNGDDLKFEVGYVSASYPIHPNFDENPECVNKFNSQPLYLAA
ncbi:unnamed protein product [Calypogeia fissa]